MVGSREFKSFNVKVLSWFLSSVPKGARGREAFTVVCCSNLPMNKFAYESVHACGFS